MLTFSYTIRDDLGIHARPAGLICREAKNFQSTVTLIKDGKRAEAVKLFALMGLCAKKGDTIEVEVVGEDEAAASQAFEKLLHDQL